MFLPWDRIFQETCSCNAQSILQWLPGTIQERSSLKRGHWANMARLAPLPINPKKGQGRHSVNREQVWTWSLQKEAAGTARMAVRAWLARVSLVWDGMGLLASPAELVCWASWVAVSWPPVHLERHRLLSHTETWWWQGASIVTLQGVKFRGEKKSWCLGNTDRWFLKAPPLPPPHRSCSSVDLGPRLHSSRCETQDLCFLQHKRFQKWSWRQKSHLF